MYVLFALIGFAIGRIGCFINWCCFGILTDLPWGIQVWDYLPVHPTQIYEIIFVLILFGLFFNYRNTSFLKKIGNTSLSIIASYSLFRALIIEPLRYGIGTEDGFLRITLLLAIFLSAALILALRNDLFTKLKNYIFLIKVKKAV